ncbi:MAG: hypothetical protein A2798_00110 [Candidatus Levybacteria bacterium RIFCSPHIGHO2_01_FULL_37_17]|nr:MAG: hypothetical protein A2798_00110 [Candidatus Levybacteria bacterium RIFCSPHIGHO2_01_FULL_37_17]OGH36501.1 MAG: hypothetical protein A2959_03255 [Candidatus Levybacteria bacterium RIFCSPLOWO2_01_FULL_38_23]
MDALDAQTKQLIKPLEDVYAKAPSLPAGVKDFIVMVAPWVAVILGVLSVLGFAVSLLGFGALGVLAPLAGSAATVSLAGFGLITTVLGLASGVLLLLAFRPLQKRALSGWNLMFWVLVLGLISTAVGNTLFYFSVVGLVMAVVWFLIELYFLFQVKSSYK